LIGIAQFLAQFVLGRQLAFFMDYFVPEPLQLTGFNRIIPLFYSSPIIKSNGVFFAEPSFYNQFLSVGLIVELVAGMRLWRVALICAGLFVSYSGTGLVMLAFVIPILIVSRGHLAIILYIAAIAMVGILLRDFLPFEGFETRLGEFSDPNSSGYARFLSPLMLLDDYVFNDLRDTLIGRGPGSINEHLQETNNLFFGPTWAKLLYEYGVLGFTAYMLFFFICMRGPEPFIAIALSVTYFFLGGYLADGNVIIQLGVIYAWTCQSELSDGRPT
jgi:hypothetical protein